MVDSYGTVHLLLNTFYVLFPLFHFYQMAAAALISFYFEDRRNDGQDDAQPPGPYFPEAVYA